MRVLIDSRCVTTPFHGIARHAVNIVKNLAEIDKKNQYILVLQEGGIRFFENLPENFAIKKISINPYTLSEQMLMPFYLKEDFDLYYTPNYTAPVLLKRPIIFTIHDLIHLLFSEGYSFFHRLYYNLIIKNLCDKSLKIVTVSESSKRDIVRFFNLPDDKIIVNYNGVDEKFSPGERDSALRYVRERFGITERFLLWVGNPKPHKNLDNTLKAFEILKRNFNSIKLVLVGAEIKGNRKNEDIIVANVSSDNELVALYRSAEVLLAPSLYEGFCLPVLEALACGCPVVTSNVSSLPEVVGDAGIMVNPGSADEIAGAVLRILNDRSLRQVLVNKGIDRAKRFKWRDSAKNLLRIFQEI